MWRVSLLTQSAIRNSHHVTDTNRKMQDAMISIYVTISQNNIIFQAGRGKNVLKILFDGFGLVFYHSEFCFRNLPYNLLSEFSCSRDLIW